MSGNFDKKRPGYLPGLLILWWALRDSNPEPRDYESISKTENKCRNIAKSVDISGFQILLTIFLFGVINLFLLRPASLFAD